MPFKVNVIYSNVISVSFVLFLHQYLDYIRDIIEPPMSEDMSMYFPEVVQHQFGFSTGSAYGPRDQEPNYFGKKRIGRPHQSRIEYVQSILCHVAPEVT